MRATDVGMELEYARSAGTEEVTRSGGGGRRGADGSAGRGGRSMGAEGRRGGFGRVRVVCGDVGLG